MLNYLERAMERDISGYLMIIIIMICNISEVLHDGAFIVSSFFQSDTLCTLWHFALGQTVGSPAKTHYIYIYPMMQYMCTYVNRYTYGFTYVV